jgi:hypothetical protein
VTTYVIAPGGNDGSGTGSAGNPWLTPGKFATVAGPGDTLLCRGGAYPARNGDTINGGPSGSAGSPITILNYPGETPVMQGLGAGSPARFLLLQAGVSYWNVDGLTFQNYSPTGSGIIWMGDPSVPTHHHGVRNCVFNILAGLTSSDQGVYLSWFADDCVVEDNIFHGAHVGGDGGTAINIGDHEPGPQRFLVQRNLFSRFGDTGAIWVNSPATTGIIRKNTFSNVDGTSVTFIRLPDYQDIVVEDNTGTNATNGIMQEIYDQDVGGTKLIRNNVWGQTFDAQGNLTSAGAVGAATDGGDCGWRGRGGGRQRKRILVMSR